MSFKDKVTIVLLTKDRPQFLLRTLDYYDKYIGFSGINLIISDVSAAEKWSVINEAIEKKKYSRDIAILHHPDDYAASHRLAKVLPLIRTPYVMLAPDDDLYFFGWLEPAVELLDRDDTFGVVYGHTIRFQLDAYKAFGRLVNVSVVRDRNPPVRWLEGASSRERLESLGLGNGYWPSMGWYALQRIELLATIVENARDNNINGYAFEKFLIFCQSAFYKSRMLDHIYIARQTDDAVSYSVDSYKKEREGLERMIEVSAKLLSNYEGLDQDTASRIVKKAISGVIAQLKNNDSRIYLRKVAESFPTLRALKCLILARFNANRFAPDKRFPRTPDVYPGHPLVAVIQEVVGANNSELS